MLSKIFKFKPVFIFTVLVLVGLTCVNLLGTNILSTQGLAVSETEAKTLKLEKENQQLSVKIEEATKLSRLEDIAKQRGFIRSKNIVFLSTTPNFASR